MVSAQHPASEKPLEGYDSATAIILLVCFLAGLYQGYVNQTLSLTVIYYAGCFFAADIVVLIGHYFKTAPRVAHDLAAGLSAIFIVQSGLSPFPQFLVYPFAWGFMFASSENAKIRPHFFNRLS